MTHPFSIELLELLIDRKHLLLVTNVDKALNTFFIRLSDELNRLALVTSLLTALTGLLDNTSIDSSLLFAPGTWSIEWLSANFRCRLQFLFQFDSLLLKLRLHRFSLYFFLILLLCHIVLERLVLLSQLHVLLHSLVQERKFTVKICGTFRLQSSLLWRAILFFIVNRKIGDNLFHTLLLNSRIISLGCKSLLANFFSRK